MSREIAGKIFCTPKEAGVTPPTEAEISHARKLFDEFQKKMDAVPKDRIRDVSPKFWDDTSGTEYERPKDG
ncbi:hypothetical protein [Mycobacterium angelicum]|uniref:Uncharacterized protein n=1 Tax=Mycobacterium angelicum TaxID=470074 RepID=A0A1W9ZJS8_MYCAN|nr:hypothetical protein [Mycobacterium angelicum]ORA16996.1 hypothetical protein BST12_20165 [Mycobacterium angelicum]